MLETNTDRSYFMIGAMIIAGLLVMGAVVVFSLITPDGWLFEAIYEWRENMLEAAKSIVAGIDT